MCASITGNAAALAIKGINSTESTMLNTNLCHMARCLDILMRIDL